MMDSDTSRTNAERELPEQSSVQPGDVRRRGGAVPPPPRNIRETKVWQSSQQGFTRAWNNYWATLNTAFQNMTREEQEALIQRVCMIVTIGVTVVAALLFYNFIPRLARVVGVPAAIWGAYWAANKIVTPVVLDRLSDVLKKSRRDDLLRKE